MAAPASSNDVAAAADADVEVVNHQDDELLSWSIRSKIPSTYNLKR